jgi:vacuolar-type H+-ATPase subunit H
MSAEAAPITLTRFASALSDLPVDAIYGKYSELRNNITHMESSNQQLEEFARENDDRDCYEALMENRQVIKRFEERIEALKREVTEVRGLPWRVRDEEEKNDAQVVGGAATTNGTAAPAREEQTNGTGPGAQGGDEENGVFL